MVAPLLVLNVDLHVGVLLGERRLRGGNFLGPAGLGVVLQPDGQRAAGRRVTSRGRRRTGGTRAARARGCSRGLLAAAPGNSEHCGKCCRRQIASLHTRLLEWAAGATRREPYWFRPFGKLA